MIVLAASGVGFLLGWLIFQSSIRKRYLRVLAEKNARISTLSDAARAWARQAKWMESLKKQLETDLKEKIRDLESTRLSLTEYRTTLEIEKEAASEKLALLKDIRNSMTESYRQLLSDALLDNHEKLVQMADTVFSKQLDTARTEMGHQHQAVEQIVLPVKEALARLDTLNREMERSRESAYGGLLEQVKALSGAQESLQKETRRLTQAMTSPDVRGRWGEMTLKRVAELAGMAD